MPRRLALASQLAGVAGALALVAVLPLLVSDFRAFQLAYVGIYFIALIGLNILTGYSGQISIGHGAFMALGGYTTAILVSQHGVRDLWTIPIAGLLAGLAGLLFGIPALRLSGLYLALATFGVAVATPAILKKAEGLTKGNAGIVLDLPKAQFGLHLSGNDWLYYLIWTIALVLLLVAWAILRGRVGRALKAVRDSEVAAASSGVNLAFYKTLAFGISAFYAGIAGSLLAIAVAFVNPDTFPITLSLFLLVGAVIGGLGSLVGVVAGAAFIEFVPIYSSSILDAVSPFDVNSRAPGVPSVIFGVVLIVVMLALPTGAGGLLRRVFGPLTSRL